jgi:hypothetical protein
MTPLASSPCDSRTCPHCTTSAQVLVEGLRSVLAVSYVPLTGLVAVLDTTTPTWVLNLDSGSSADDHCWALLDVLRVLAFGADAAESARRVPALRVVRS